MASKKRPTVNLQNASIAKRAGYVETLKQITSDDVCPFCEEFFLSYHTKPILFKTKYWIVTPNAWPYEGSEQHYLFVLRNHKESAESLTPKEWTDLGAAFTKLASTKKIPGASLLMRTGDTARTGATVRHLHAQVIVGAKKKEGSGTLTALIGFKKTPSSTKTREHISLPSRLQRPATPKPPRPR